MKLEGNTIRLLKKSMTYSSKFSKLVHLIHVFREQINDSTNIIVVLIQSSRILSSINLNRMEPFQEMIDVIVVFSFRSKFVEDLLFHVIAYCLREFTIWVNTLPLLSRFTQAYVSRIAFKIIWLR